VLDWNDLRYVLALRQAGSLAKAGALLRVDKATVARRIDALESAIGARLVQRSAAGYRLTEQGERSVVLAQDIAQRVAEFEAVAAGRRSRAQGAVRVTAPAWFCRHILIPALPEFRAAQPDVELQLLTTNLVVSMPRREADIAIRNLRPAQAGLAARKLGALHSSLYGARGYFARAGMPQEAGELAARHLLSYQDRITYVPGYHWLEGCGAPVAFRASDTLALAEACIAGLGLAVLPCAVAGRELGLQAVPFAGREAEDIWLVMPRELVAQPAVRATSDWLARLFRAHQAQLAGS